MSGKLDWQRAEARDARRARLAERRDPRGKPNALPISEPQRELIRSLAAELGIPEPDGIATRSGASATIANLKRIQRQRKSRTSRD